MSPNESNGELTLDVLLQLRDYLRATYWFLFRKTKWLLLVAVPGLLLTVYGGAQSSTWASWGFVFPAALALIFVMPYFGAKRSMASNKSLQEPVRYTFSEGGVDALARSSSGHTDWANIYRAFETKHNFLLFISQNQMYTIPKRCFADNEQMNAFRNLVGGQLLNRAKLRKG